MQGAFGNPWSDVGDGPPQRLIRHPGIDLGGRNLPVAQRPLDEVQVPGLLVERGGEGVVQGVDRDGAVNARVLNPPGELELDRPGTEASPRLVAK